jgi:hypothetical protein
VPVDEEATELSGNPLYHYLRSKSPAPFLGVTFVGRELVYDGSENGSKRITKHEYLTIPADQCTGNMSYKTFGHTSAVSSIAKMDPPLLQDAVTCSAT